MAEIYTDPSEMCAGNMYHWWDTRIPSDSDMLGMRVRGTLYPGKHVSLWHRYNHRPARLRILEVSFWTIKSGCVCSVTISYNL